MPTVIDSLVVTLGLDAKQFNEEQQKSVKYLQELESATKKHGGNATRGVNEMVTAFKELQGRLLAIGALVAAGLGFNRLTQDVTKAATALGQLSTTMNMSAQDLDAWEKAGRSVGAATGEMTQNLQSLKSQIQEFRATGRSELQALMGQVGISPMTQQDTPESVAKRLSQWYAGQKDKGYASHLLQSRGGLSQGMINMLGLGPEELQKRLDTAKRIAPTNEEIERFKKLTEAFGNLINVVDRLTQQALAPFIASMTKILNMLTGWLTKWATSNQSPPAAAGEGMAKLGMPELAPNAQEPSLTQRGWNWLMGRPNGDSGAGAGAGGGGGGGSAAAPGAAPGGAQPSTPGAVSPGGSEFLRNERQGFTDQMNDPTTRRNVAGMAMLEGARDPVPVIESLANRLGYVNSERAKQGLPPVTVNQMLNSGFYGPINRGGLPGAVSQLNNNPELAGRMNRAIDTVSGGSNVTQGYTDQGLRTDPNGWRMPRLERGGNVFNDWNGGPGGYRAAAAYRERLQQGVAGEVGSRGVPSAPMTPGITGAQRTFENWQNLGLGKGAALRDGDTNTTNSNTNTMNIGSMNVSVPPGSDPSAYADGITRRLGDYNNVAHANTGLV